MSVTITSCRMKWRRGLTSCLDLKRIAPIRNSLRLTGEIYNYFLSFSFFFIDECNFRAASLKYHPDKQAQTKEEHDEDIMKAIVAAYAFLKVIRKKNK